MSAGLSLGVLLAALSAVAFAGLYILFSAFAQALESLSAVGRTGLLEEDRARFGLLVAAERLHPARVAVRLSAQGAVMGGVLSLGTLFAALSAPEPWLVSALTILLGWIAFETLVLRWVARRGSDALLRRLSFLIPFVSAVAAPLLPFLSRLLAPPPEETGEFPPVPEREVSKETEVRALLDVAREEGILEEHEEELVSRAVDFSDRTVREVMTPRADMTVAEASAPLAEVADLFVRTKFTRIPLVEGSVEKPVGVVHVKDVFTVLRDPSPPATARPLAREPFFAPESQTVATLLADFRRRRQHLAIVVDEYGVVTGLVTLEDLVEELVGEIADEHEDALDPVIPLAGGAFSVAGRVRIAELGGLFGTEFPPAEFDTLAGLVTQRLGHIPRVGESLRADGLELVVEEADKKRVYRVRVRKLLPEPVASGGAA